MVTWLAPRDGGRARPPGSAETPFVYGAVGSFSLEGGQRSEPFSVALRFNDPEMVPGVDYAAEVSFMRPESASELIRPGARLVLSEGTRPVATVLLTSLHLGE